MADRTASGAPVDDRSRRLIVRKMELQLQRHLVSILEAELGIEQAHDQISRFEEQITATQATVQQLREDIEVKKQEATNG